MEYVYLLQVYPGSYSNIFKFGRTVRHFPERFKEYSRAQPKIILVLSCMFCDILEKRILKEIKSRYVMRNDIGKEYFEGPIQEIKNLVLDHHHDHEIEYPVSKDKIGSKDSDLDKSLEELRDTLGEILKDEAKKEILLAKYSNDRRALRIMSEYGNIFGPGYDIYFDCQDAEMRSFLGTLLPKSLETNDTSLMLKASKDKTFRKILTEDQKELLIRESIEGSLYSQFNFLIDIFDKEYEKYEEMMHKDDKELFKGYRTNTGLKESLLDRIIIHDVVGNTNSA